MRSERSDSARSVGPPEGQRYDVISDDGRGDQAYKPTCMIWTPHGSRALLTFLTIRALESVIHELF